MCFSHQGPFSWQFNTLGPRQNGPHSPAIFKCIFFNENVSILIKMSLKFFPKSLIYNIPTLVQIMDCHLVSGKPLSEPMLVSLPTHICVTRPQWVKTLGLIKYGCHFTADIFKVIFLNKNCYILIKISMKFIPKCPSKNNPALIQIMAWHQTHNEHNELTHWGLVTPYGDRDLGQHWLR